MAWGPMPLSGDPAQISSKIVAKPSPTAKDNPSRLKHRAAVLIEKKEVKKQKSGNEASQVKFIQLMTLKQNQYDRGVFKFHQVLESRKENAWRNVERAQNKAKASGDYSEVVEKEAIYDVHEKKWEEYSAAMENGDHVRLQELGYKPPDDKLMDKLIEDQKKRVVFDLTKDDEDDGATATGKVAEANMGNIVVLSDDITNKGPIGSNNVGTPAGSINRMATSDFATPNLKAPQAICDTVAQFTTPGAKNTPGAHSNATSATWLTSDPEFKEAYALAQARNLQPYAEKIDNDASVGNATGFKADDASVDDGTRSTISSTIHDHIGGMVQMARRNERLIADMNDPAKIDALIAKIPPTSIQLSAKGQVPEESQLTMAGAFDI